MADDSKQIEATVESFGNYFTDLSQIRCNTDNKNGFTYISWMEEWRQLKAQHPGAQYVVLRTEDGKYVHGEGFVRTVVTVPVDGVTITHEMMLPVMDFRNKSITNPDTMQINAAIMRCLAKNIAMHGLGSYPFIGEDIPTEITPLSNDGSSSGIGISKANRGRIAKAAKGKKGAKAVFEKHGLSKGASADDVDVDAVIADLNAL